MRLKIFLKELMLQETRLTLAAAESMTSGRVQAAVGSISGASNFFRGGITAYTLDEKVRHLGVNRAAAKRVDCVSAEIAGQMASGVCGLFDADLGVATTGYAEPDMEKGVSDPFAWWALAHRRRPFGKLGAGGRFVMRRHGRVECAGAKRIEAQTIVAEAVMAELLQYLRELRSA